MVHQTVWMYVYPFSICSLFWDRVTNRLVAGTTDGTVQQLETTLVDQTTAGVAQGIAWNFTTREWSTPVDLLLENLQSELVGTGTWRADVDNTNTFTMGTMTQTSKGWAPATMSASTGDNINFLFNGTQSGTQQGVYSLSWDSIPETPRVTYYQTDPIAVPSENYVKTWLPNVNPFQGTITASVLLDGTVVQTAKLSSTNTGDLSLRKVFEVELPNVTYGKNISAIYRSTTPFRYYDTEWEFEPKPFFKETWLVTYKKAGGVTQADMARFYAMDLEGTSTTTITNSWIIDGTLFSTNTLLIGGNNVGEESGIARNYMDQIPFPPGGRGYLFQQQITSTSSIATPSVVQSGVALSTATDTGTTTFTMTNVQNGNTIVIGAGNVNTASGVTCSDDQSTVYATFTGIGSQDFHTAQVYFIGRAAVTGDYVISVGKN